MRFYKPVKIAPDNRQRVVKRFAFFPTRMSDGTIVWLERYLQHQYYGVFGWTDTKPSSYGAAVLDWPARECINTKSINRDASETPPDEFPW